MINNNPIPTVTERAFEKAKELDAVISFLYSECVTGCKDLPIATYDALRKYQIKMYNQASAIIGYIQQLQNEIKELKTTK